MLNTRDKNEMFNNSHAAVNFIHTAWQKVTQKKWESFCELEDYINNIYFYSRNIQTKFTDL